MGGGKKFDNDWISTVLTSAFEMNCQFRFYIYSPTFLELLKRKASKRNHDIIA